MDVENTLREAQNGNASAMLSLVDYYMHTEKSHADALKWADAAADAGSSGGYYLSAYLHSLSARAMEAMRMIDGMKNEWQLAYNRTRFIQAALENNVIKWDESQKAMFRELREETHYYLALSMAYQQNYENPREIIALLEPIETTKAQFLRGFCNHHLDKLSEAYHCLNKAFQDQNYANTEKELMEEGVYADALNSLSMFYRDGIPGTVKRDLKKAVEVLERGVETIKDDDLSQALKNELAHYQKKLFGGYKYV